MKHQIVLADDHQLFRQALRLRLELLPDMKVVAEAQDGNSVIEATVTTNPDVVCLDLTMPGLSSTETIRQLLSIKPLLKIIAISAHGDLFRVAKAISAGAMAYVTKMDIGKQLPEAIVSVSQNTIYFSPDLGIKDVTDLQAYANDEHDGI